MKVEISGSLACYASFDVESGGFSLGFDEYLFEAGHVGLLDDDNEVEWGNNLADLRVKVTEKTLAPALKARYLGAIDSAIATFNRTYFPLPTGYSRDQVDAETQKRREERKHHLVDLVRTSGSRWAVQALKEEFGAEVEITVTLVDPPAPLSEAA